MLKRKFLLLTFALGVFLITGQVFAECLKPVCVSVKKMNADAGTLEVYMTNQAGCIYWVGTDELFSTPSTSTECEALGSCSDATIGICSDGTSTDQTTCVAESATWTSGTKAICEASGTCSDGTSTDQTTCVAASATWATKPSGQLGTWSSRLFDGSVKAFSFYLTGATLASVSNGTCSNGVLGTCSDGTSTDQTTCDAVPGTWTQTNITTCEAASATWTPGGSSAIFDFTQLDNSADCNNDTVDDAGCSYVLSASFGSAYIPVGTDQLLLSTTFSDYTGNGMCFAGTDQVTDWTYPPKFSDINGLPASVGWGSCACDDPDGDGVCDDALGTVTDACPDTPSGAEVDATGCSTTAAISQVGSNLPEEFSISQNFPNPFNPVTSISFDVAEMDDISLVVYDLAGKEVVTLASGIYSPGRYMIEWNGVNNIGDGIVSGMYIYRFIFRDKAITRKMLYLK